MALDLELPDDPVYISPVADDVEGVIAEVMAAEDSKTMGLAMRKYVTARLLRLIGDGKVGGGDLVRLMGMLNDRVDGKVADRVEVSGEVKEERSITVRFVRGDAELSKDALGGLVDGGRAAEVVDG